MVDMSAELTAAGTVCTRAAAAPRRGAVDLTGLYQDLVAAFPASQVINYIVKSIKLG